MHWLQNHWYRTTRLHLILVPISLIFHVLIAFRRELYQNGMKTSERLLLPVIVIGNISVGGTGKTPLTLALAQQLIERGWHPLIVSRGYKSSATYPQQVQPRMSALQAGDEPLLMARRKICPVWIGRDRAATARAALQVHLQCDIVLCDDGLQHYRLQRDVEIAVIDGERGFGTGWLLPAGPLREPVSRLQTVDAVVVNGGTVATGQYAMRLEGSVFYNLLDPGQTATADDLRKRTAVSHGSKVHAVAGIGNPQRFFNHLEQLGIAFTPHPFPDHHQYSASDLAFADCEAILLTEKDAVKCASFADARYWVLRVDALVDPDLLEHILRKIKSHGFQTA